MRALLLASVVAFGWSGAAQATITTFTVSGTFNNGAALSGQFTLDNSKSIFADFTNVDLNVAGFPVFTQNTGVIQAGSNANGTLVEYIFSTSDYVDGLSLELNAIVDSSLDTQTIFAGSVTPTDSKVGSSGGAIFELNTGAIAVLPTAVPEPASLALLGLPLGLIGLLTMCRRQGVVEA